MIDLKKNKKNMNEDFKVREKQIKRNNIFLFFAAIAMVAIIMYIYSLCSKAIYERVINSSIQNMEELAKHDEKSILSGIEHRWEEIDSVAEEIKNLKVNSIDEMLNILNLRAKTTACIEYVLLSEDGKAFGSSKKMEDSKKLLDLCEESNEEFVYRRVNSDISISYIKNNTDKDILLIGKKLKEPFLVNGNTIKYALTYYDISTLTDELRIDSYNGEGYSSVINTKGDYLVYQERENTSFERNNFYEIMQNADIKSGITVEEIYNKISSRESVSFQYELENEDRIMVCTPMENLRWYFVMSVPMEFFQNRANSLLELFTILAGAILVAIILVVILALRNRSQKSLMKYEMKHGDELKSALAMAEQANRAKTTFLNNMSHDIRTPMNAIMGFTSLAITHIDNKERVKDYLEKIKQSSDHLLSLINDVLDMSRIESGKVNIEEKEENLADILHSIRNIVQADIYAKQMEFVIDTINITDESIYCDKLRVNQILINLLSNAIKFTQPGGKISLHIKQKPVEKKGYGTYEFKVKDTGIGISKQFIKEIFEPFARERNSTVSGIQGTGLGMAITKKIVDMMGGTIKIDSKEGKGTEITVTLDFRLQEEHREIEVIEKLQGMRALVVDDDMNTCQSLSYMLRQLGLKSEWTMYGKEAVVRTKEALQMKDEFEVYFVDWLMPDMNGIETARRIRKAIGDKAIIILLSAYDWAEVEDEAKEAGINEFISKPLFPSDIRSLLMKSFKIEEKKNGEDEEEFDFTGKRVLLVEDNMMNREIATEYLNDFGILVETAENGKEACDILKNAQPGYFDLVLMDIQMPIMNGYDATRAIRKFSNKQIANIPIIAMTANAFEEDKKLAKEAGMNGHVAKPIDIKQLIKPLKEILG